MRFARRFWMAGLCALGVLVSATAVQAQAVKLLPNDTELVVTVNLQQILKSDIAKDNKALVEIAKTKLAGVLEEKGIDKWLDKAGFDLFRDLSSMTFAMPTRGPDDGFIVLEGKFDAAKIEATAKEASKEAGGGLKMSKIAGIKAFEITPPDEKTMYVGILSKKTMIACASKKDFEIAVARFNGEEKADFKSDVFKKSIGSVNSKQSISFVATSEAIAKVSESIPNQQAKAGVDLLKKMDGFSMAITIQKDIDLQVGINAKDEKTAKEFAGQANLLIGVLKGRLKDQAENDAKAVPLLNAVNTIRATTEGANLQIRGQISAETLGKLLANLPGMN